MNVAERELELLAAHVHGRLVAMHEIGEYYNNMLLLAPNRPWQARVRNRAMAAFHRFAAIISATGYKLHKQELDK